MNVFVVIGHQNPGSFCHAIAAAAVEELEAAGHSVVFHDLYAEKFDPILPDAEIPEGCPARSGRRPALPGSGGGRRLSGRASEPWAMPPAILKGWLDRVIRPGVTHRFGPNGPIPVPGSSGRCIHDVEYPAHVELDVYGDPLENLWKTCIFGMIGVADFYRRNFESIIMSTPDQRRAWLDEVRQIVRERFPRQA